MGIFQIIPSLLRKFLTLRKFLILRKFLTGAGLVGLFLGMGLEPLSAEQQDTIRIGDDYEILRLPRGASWQDCRRKCQNDERCAAWTFVKERTVKKKKVTLDFGGIKLGLGGSRREIIPAQCRLKYAVPEARSNSCCVSGVKKVARLGRRACVEYAEKAIDQYDQNLARRCGFKGEQWHGNFRRHFRYCKNNKRRRLEATMDDRAEALEECRTRVTRARARCDRYARAAVRDFRENKRLHCGFGESQYWGNRNIWHNDSVRHFQWCVKVRPPALVRRAERRADDLSQCRIAARLCDDFARRAVRHQRRNRRLRCGFKGPLWNSDRTYHHERCMIMPKWRRTRDLDIRRRRIRNCERRR